MNPLQVKPASHSKKASHSQMNIRGVFLHVLGDALGSIVVIVSALVVWLAGDEQHQVKPYLHWGRLRDNAGDSDSHYLLALATLG